MDEDEKIGLLWHASTGGTFTAMYPYTEEWLYSNEPTYTDQDGGCYVPMYHSIISDHVTTYLHNVNGTPDTLIYENNAFQEIAESARLGIPVVLSCDRSYNTWAGLVNMPNYAVGIAHDEELLYELVAQYAKEERAIGFHLPFHSYGVEIGSWYGDEVNYIAKMVGIETKAYQENGVNATTKHFVARGGRSSYSGAKSPANLLDSWLVGWKSAVIDNGSGWVMLNNGTLLNSCNVCYDSESMAVLRETLGYDGCVVTDWPMWMQVPSASGVTPEGLDLSTATVAQLYATIFNADVDQVGCFFMVEDDVPIEYEAVIAKYPGMMQPMWPNEVKAAVEQGILTWETLEKHCFRVLRNKFDLGLFEDPYSNLDEVLDMVASEEYKADIKCDTLVISQTVISWEEEGSSGVQTQTAARNVVAPGQPFNLYFIAQNFGAGDGTLNAVVTDNGEPIAEKMIALTAGQFRVITIEITLEAGAHDIEVLGMTMHLDVQ